MNLKVLQGVSSFIRIFGQKNFSHLICASSSLCFTDTQGEKMSGSSALSKSVPVNSHPSSPSEVDPSEKRRGRAPLNYTDEFETPSSILLNAIGVVRSPYKERFGTPRQPNIIENTLGNKQQAARIELYEHTRYALSLRGLADFEYCWVISYFHLNQGFNPLVKPPRGPRQRKHGLFATRSPHRPNSIGLSCIRITSVNESKGVIHLLGVDLLDGTAVLDIKPYVPYCDAFPNARAGWLDTLNEDMKAPDTLNYSPPPAHLMRPVSPLDGEESDQITSESKDTKNKNTLDS